MRDRKEARDAEFQSFVVGRWPRLLRTAFLLPGEQHAAEDLVQSTLEQAYAAWRRVGAAEMSMRRSNVIGWWMVVSSGSPIFSMSSMP